MAKKSSNDEMKMAVEMLKEQARQQASLNQSLETYLERMTKLKAISETIAANKKIEKQLQEKLQAAAISGDMKLVRQERLKLKILKDQTDELKGQGEVLAEQLKSVNKSNMLLAKGGAALVKSFSQLPDLVKNSFGKLKQFGLFEIDKSIKKSALSMGILSKQSIGFRADLKEASKTTIQLGVGIEDLAKIQGDYSDELGRTVTLGQTGLEAMGKLAAATGLGAEGAAKMAADMETQGYSAERTAEFVEQTMDDAHKMGVNASKVIKNIQNNIKLLNKYNFKGGVKGLAKMAETTTKLGVDMNFVAGMADKLFDIEGAVDMSAQLQVLGGEWAKLADPFKLMYMARNDMAGLTEAVGNAAAASAKFNKETGEFEISALEMHRLRKIAEQTGIAYEDLAQAGKNAAKFSKIKTQMSFDVDKETKEFLSTTAKFNNKGEAYIEIAGNPKLLKNLSAADKQLLHAQVLEKESLADRAKNAQTFDDQLTNMMNMFKSAALPLIESINKNLMPKMQKLFDKILKGKWLDKIGDFANRIGDLVSTIGGWIIDNPIKSAFAFGAAKLVGFLADKVTWINNGLDLATGFNLGTTGGGTGGGGFLKALQSVFKGGAGGLGGLAKSIGKLGGYVSLAASAISIGMSAYKNYSDDKMNFWDATWKTLKDNAGKLIGGAIGGVGGFLVGGPAGAVVGAGYGSQIGGSFDTSEGVNDAIIGKPIHDGAIPSAGGNLGGDFSKGRGIIQGGQITPIDNKDDLIASKPNGVIDKAMKGSTPSTMKIEFGEIHFKFDELKVTSPGSPGLSVDLLKDPQFIRNITRLIHVETNKAITGGKISPNPR